MMGQMSSQTGSYLREWKTWIDGQDALLEHTKDELFQSKKKVGVTKIRLGNVTEAHNVLIEATAATQNQVKEFVEELVSLALQSVFGIEYSFILEFHERRGQVELEPIIMWQQEPRSPRDEVGGGVVDVASFALRLVLWALSAKRSSPVFILDEPFKFVSKDMTDSIAAMLKSVADLLGIQIIMVSHDDGLIAAADRSWTVTKKGDVSVVEMNQ